MTTTEENIFMKFGREIPKGFVIFKEGEKGDIMFLIRKGKIKIYKTFTGDKENQKIEKELAIFGKGDFFGEMSLLNNELRSATAIALEDSEVLEISNTIFEKLIKTNGNFALKIIAKLSERVRNTSNVIKDGLMQHKHHQIAFTVASIMENNTDSISFDTLFDEIKKLDNADSNISKEELKQLIDTLVKLSVLNVSGEIITTVDNSKLADILTLLGAM